MKGKAIAVTLQCPRCHLSIADVLVRAKRGIMPMHHTISAPVRTWALIDGKQRMFDHQLICPESGARFSLDGEEIK